METGVPSSFIPSDTMEPEIRKRPGRSGRGSLTDFGALIGIVLLVASVALAIGVFLYTQFLETSKENKLDQLERARAAFEPALILELTRLDDRMNVAGTLLAQHLAPTMFFRMLELVTLETVSFRSLNLSVVDAQNITIAMDGVAQSVNSIALQADLFSKNGVITSPIFTNINRQDDGVHFKLTALINPGAIRYAQLFLAPAQQQQPVQEAPEEEASPFTPSPAVPAPQTGPGIPPGQRN